MKGMMATSRPTEAKAATLSEEIEAQLRTDGERAHRFLGVQKGFLIDFPAAALDRVTCSPSVPRRQ
jgi:hypothetical protein